MFLEDSVAEIEARGLPVRVLGPKARQVGESTWAQARLGWRAFFFGKNGLTLAHLEEPAGELFSKTEFIWEHLPEEIRPQRDNRRKGKKLKLKAPPYGSGALLYVDHAENEKAARSQTFQQAHLSEVAFWRNPREVMRGLLRSVPRNPGTVVIAESSGNGQGDWFHEACVRAESGEGVWDLLFIPWFKMRSYQRAPRRDDKPPTPQERALMDKYNLSEAQIMWRRDVENEDGVESIRQEYPYELSDCFRSSGAPYIEPEVIELHNKTVRPPARTGMIRERIGGPPSFVDDDLHGDLWIFERPAKNERYVISGDVASGGARDRSALHVLTATAKPRQAASYRGHIDPDQFALLMARLGMLYNRALLVPERNGPGLATVTALVDLNYPNLFRAERIGSSEYAQSKDFGWLTSHRNRDWMLERMKEFLSKQEILLRCSRTIQELQNLVYVQTPSGAWRAEANRGAFDDMPMALAIGLATYQDAVPAGPPVNVPADPYL